MKKFSMYRLACVPQWGQVLTQDQSNFYSQDMYFCNFLFLNTFKVVPYKSCEDKVSKSKNIGLAQIVWDMAQNAAVKLFSVSSKTF